MASGSKSRKLVEASYKKAYAEIPNTLHCAICGRHGVKESFSRHHPAGRRKTSFLFTVQICEFPCHRNVHLDQKMAERIGMLWKGRNSKTFTLKDAQSLIGLWPFHQTYPIEIFKTFSPTKPL